jgi:hypothetical protein
MECPECNTETEKIDDTYSNYHSKRASVGAHTGNIYKCENCEKLWLENLLSGRIESWSY